MAVAIASASMPCAAATVSSDSTGIDGPPTRTKATPAPPAAMAHPAGALANMSRQISPQHPCRGHPARRRGQGRYRRLHFVAASSATARSNSDLASACDDAIGGRRDRFAEIGAARRGIAAIGDAELRNAVIGLVEAAKLCQHRRQHAPAASVGRVLAPDAACTCATRLSIGCVGRPAPVLREPRAENPAVAVSRVADKTPPPSTGKPTSASTATARRQLWARRRPVSRHAPHLSRSQQAGGRSRPAPPRPPARAINPAAASRPISASWSL